MSHTFDFIVLGAHGAGLNAFHAFANMITGIECIDWKTSTDTLKDRLHGNPHKKTGLVVDRGDIKRNGRLEFILQNLSEDCLLICLERDPCARLKSVINTHIQWWAESVAGTFDLPLSSNRLFLCGDEVTLLKSLIKDPIMNTLVKLFKEFSPRCRDILFYDMSDLFPQNAASTFQRISDILFGRSLENFPVTDHLPFSRENRFVDYIKPLNLEDNLKLKPCPVEFLPFYGYSQHDIVETFSPHEYGFTLGDIPGDVALVPLAPRSYTAKHPVYSIQKPKREILQAYIDDLSRRHLFAKKLAKPLFLTDEKLLKFSAADAELELELGNFISSQVELISKAAPEQLSHWETSENILAHLKYLHPIDIT